MNRLDPRDSIIPDTPARLIRAWQLFDQLHAMTAAEDFSSSSTLADEHDRLLALRGRRFGE